MPYNLQEDSNDRHVSSSSERPLSEEVNTRTSEKPFIIMGHRFSIQILGRSTTTHMVVRARAPLTGYVCGLAGVVPFELDAESKYQNIV
jgi:hypothetical protein